MRNFGDLLDKNDRQGDEGEFIGPNPPNGRRTKNTTEGPMPKCG